MTDHPEKHNEHTGAEDHFHLPDGALSSIIQASPIGMLLVDEEHRMLFANNKFLSIFAIQPQELPRLTLEDLMPERFRADHPAQARTYFGSAEPRPMGLSSDLKGLTRDGREIDLEIGLSPVEVEGRTLVLASVIDISDRVRVRTLEQHNQELRTVAHRDPLTNLPNRRLFLEQVDDLRDTVIRHGARIIVMFLDLDGFKAINDRFSHAVGDELLKQVAAQINAHVRRQDVVSRMGGDEFLVCYADVDTDFDAHAAAERMVSAISGITAGDSSMNVGVSIGVISTGLDHSIAIDAIVDAADRLMYKAKLGGKNQAVVENYSLFPDP
jgi:diguanylate cyclase (GGDEF)-like protein/PAS domain S-box-containing protein